MSPQAPGIKSARSGPDARRQDFFAKWKAEGYFLCCCCCYTTATTTTTLLYDDDDDGYDDDYCYYSYYHYYDSTTTVLLFCFCFALQLLLGFLKGRTHFDDPPPPAAPQREPWAKTRTKFGFGRV